MTQALQIGIGLSITMPLGAGGAGAYSLSADQAAYNLTGINVDLSLTIGMVASVGTFTLSGQDASFLRSLGLAMDQGSLALSGQTLSFLRGYALTQDVGTFSLSGQAATLTYIQYSPNAAYFDGTNDYLTRSGAWSTVPADSKLVLFSFWIKMDAAGDGVSQEIYSVDASGGGLYNMIRRTATNTLYFRFEDNVSTLVILGETTETVVGATGWVHVLGSFDAANTANRHIYLNDVAATMTYSTYANSNMAFTKDVHAVGARSSSGTSLFHGAISDFALWNGVYVDLSVTANRRLFIDASGRPVDLSKTGGAVATHGTPLVLLKTAVPNFETNSGNGGNFTEVGTLTSVTGP